MENTALVALEESELDMVAGGGCRRRRRNRGHHHHHHGRGGRLALRADDIIIVNIGDGNTFDASNGGTIIIGASDF